MRSNPGLFDRADPYADEIDAFIAEGAGIRTDPSRGTRRC